jgi:hypothetical protein
MFWPARVIVKTPITRVHEAWEVDLHSSPRSHSFVLCHVALDIGVHPLASGMQILPLGWQEIVCAIATEIEVEQRACAFILRAWRKSDVLLLRPFLPEGCRRVLVRLTLDILLLHPAVVPLGVVVFVPFVTPRSVIVRVTSERASQCFVGGNAVDDRAVV